MTCDIPELLAGRGVCGDPVGQELRGVVQLNRLATLDEIET